MVPSEPEIIRWTPWDLALITVDHIQKGILLPKPGTGGAQLVDDLASSFASALGSFYPLAGRLTASEITDSVSSPSLAISLCCNGEGAVFIHAVALEVTVSHITTSLYIPSVVWSFPLNRLLNVEAVVSSLPVLSVQVTELADGIFIAMSLNHGVADGVAFWLFFNTWSEINRSSRLCWTDGSSSPALCNSLYPLASWRTLSGNLSTRTLVQGCFFDFSAESINRLKTKANAEIAGTATATVSSLQSSLFAHLWWTVCRAQGLAPHLDTTYKLAIGWRARLKSVPQVHGQRCGS